MVASYFKGTILTYGILSRSANKYKALSVKILWLHAFKEVTYTLRTKRICIDICNFFRILN